MSNETSGITHLNPEMLLPMDIDLPSSKNSCFKGLSQAKRLSWMIIIGNTLSAFTVGLTIAGAMHFALAEGIAVTIAFLMQERVFTDKYGRTTTRPCFRFCPSQLKLKKGPYSSNW